jgi:hypothetical protein
MNLISLPNEGIDIVIELFDTLGDIVVIRQVCRMLKDVCDGALKLPSLETEMAVDSAREEIALALGNNGGKKVFSPEVVEHRAEIVRTRVRSCLKISDIEKDGLGFWFLHVPKLHLHGIDEDRYGW